MAGKFPKNRVQHQGAGYDDAGRMTTLEGRNVEYDFDGRITKITVSTGPTSNEQTMWFYDGEGRRVREEKWTGGVSGPVTRLWETVFVYDPLGTLVAEYDTRGPQGTAGTKYLTADHLGSTRLVTKGSGNTEAEVVDSRHDYLPFGEEVRSGGGPKEKFTGNERTELTLAGARVDYFGARYLSAGLGRFTSPDPDNDGAHLAFAQSWNLYTYGWNNPHRFVDKDGRAIQFIPAAVGAAVGFVTNFAGSAISQKIQKGEVDWAVATKVGGGWCRNWGPLRSHFWRTNSGKGIVVTRYRNRRKRCERRG